jgi:23S rRNA (cytosine1962-C5)-methyltransferase
MPTQRNSATFDIEPLRNRLAKNYRHWSRWARRLGIECYRLYDRDVPQFPLAIDRYGPQVHLQEFDTGWKLADADYEAWTDAVVDAVSRALELPPASIHYKRRVRQRGSMQYGKLSSGVREFAVREGGLSFLVNLDSYVDTGLFLDHRKTRAYVCERAAGRRFLNLFCYTGSFSVYAAAGGAATSESVDLSNTYLAWAARNFKLNGIDAGRHALVRADALAYLDEAVRQRRQFDLIVLDPPSFSNSARMRETLDVFRDHPRLIDGCMALLAQGGELIFSTNRRGFALDESIRGRFRCESIDRWTIPEDFHARGAHLCWRIQPDQPDNGVH